LVFLLGTGEPVPHALYFQGQAEHFTIRKK
jgi:hypothetical protein